MLMVLLAGLEPARYKARDFRTTIVFTTYNLINCSLVVWNQSSSVLDGGCIFSTHITITCYLARYYHWGRFHRLVHIQPRDPSQAAPVYHNNYYIF